MILLVLDLAFMILFLTCFIPASFLSKSVSSINCAPPFFLKLVFTILSYYCSYIFFSFFSKSNIFLLSFLILFAKHSKNPAINSHINRNLLFRFYSYLSLVLIATFSTNYNRSCSSIPSDTP